MTGEPTGLLHAGGATALPGAGSAWIDSLRQAGARRFSGLGLPTRKVEDWKYTDLRALSGSAWDLPVAPADSPDIADDASAVLVNGCWMEGRRPLPDGVELVSLARAIEEGDDVVRHHLGSVASLARKHFVALNTAWLADGLVLKVADGVTVDEPLTITLAGAPGSRRLAWHPRNLIVLGRGASLTLVVRHVGSGDYLANLVEEVVLDRGSRLRHYRIQDDSSDAVHVSTTEVKVAGDAAYESFVLGDGSRNGAQPDCRRTQRTRRFGPSGRGLPGPPSPAARHHHRHRPCGAALHQPRSLPLHPGRQCEGRLPGAGHRAQACRRYRQPPVQQDTAALRQGRCRRQAGTGNLCRRCRLRSRSDGRRDRSGCALLPAQPGHPSRGSARPPHRRLHRGRPGDHRVTGGAGH